MSKYCAKCGKELNENAKFCDECGSYSCTKKRSKLPAKKMIIAIIGIILIGASGVYAVHAGMDNLVEEYFTKKVYEEKPTKEIVSSDENRKVTYSVTIKEMENTEFNYPEFYCSVSSKVIDELNKKYKQEVQEYVETANILPEEMDEKIVIDNRYELNYQSENGCIVALTKSGHLYGGGSSNMPYKESIILNLKNGEEMEAYEVKNCTRDVVEIATKAAFLEDIMKYDVSEGTSDKSGKYYDTAIDTLLDSDYDSFSYSLSNEGIIVTSGKWLLGPKIVEITIYDEDLAEAKELQKSSFTLSPAEIDALELKIDLLSNVCKKESCISSMSIDAALNCMQYLLHTSPEVDLSSREEMDNGYYYRIRKEEVQEYLMEVYGISVTEEELEEWSYYDDGNENYYTYFTEFGDTFTSSTIESYTQVTEDIVVFQGEVQYLADEETLDYMLITRINPNSPLCGLQLISLNIR